MELRWAALLGVALALQACATDDYQLGSLEYSCAAEAKLSTGAVSAFRGFTATGKPVAPMLGWFHPLAWYIFRAKSANPGWDAVRLDFRTPSPGETQAKPADLEATYLFSGPPSSVVWLTARMGEGVWRKLLFHPCTGAEASPRCGGAVISLTVSGPDFERAFARGDPLELYLQAADGKVLDSHGEPLAEREKAAAVAVPLWSGVQAMAAQYRTRCDRSVTID